METNLTQLSNISVSFRHCFSTLDTDTAGCCRQASLRSVFSNIQEYVPLMMNGKSASVIRLSVEAWSIECRNMFVLRTPVPNVHVWPFVLAVSSSMEHTAALHDHMSEGGCMHAVRWEAGRIALVFFQLFALRKY